MTDRLTKSQIAQELEVNAGLQRALDQRRIQLQKQMQKAFPAEPFGATMFTLSLRYTMKGKRYQFLILRSGGHYWTTGTQKDQQVFSSWESLCEWLEGPDVYDHTGLEILRSSGTGLNFESGRIEDLETGEVPF